MLLALSPANDFRVVRCDIADGAAAQKLTERWAKLAFASVRGKDPLVVTPTEELLAYDDEMPMPEGWTQEDVRLREGGPTGLEVSFKYGTTWTLWKAVPR